MMMRVWGPEESKKLKARRTALLESKGRLLSVGDVTGIAGGPCGSSLIRAWLNELEAATPCPIPDHLRRSDQWVQHLDAMASADPSPAMEYGRTEVWREWLLDAVTAPANAIAESLGLSDQWEEVMGPGGGGRGGSAGWFSDMINDMVMTEMDPLADLADIPQDKMRRLRMLWAIRGVAQQIFYFGEDMGAVREAMAEGRDTKTDLASPMKALMVLYRVDFEARQRRKFLSEEARLSAFKATIEEGMDVMSGLRAMRNAIPYHSPSKPVPRQMRQSSSPLAPQ